MGFFGYGSMAGDSPDDCRSDLPGLFFLLQILHETLQLGWMASTRGGLFFIGNGFYIEHMIGGRLGFQLFPLGPIIVRVEVIRRCGINAAISP